MRFIVWVFIVVVFAFGLAMYIIKDPAQQPPLTLKHKPSLCDWKLALKASKDRTGSTGSVQVVVQDGDVAVYDVFLLDRGQEYPVVHVDTKVKHYPIASSDIMSVLFHMRIPPSDEATLIGRDKSGNVVNIKATVQIILHNPPK